MEWIADIRGARPDVTEGNERGQGITWTVGREGELS